MMYDPADWVATGWDDGTTGFRHTLEGCDEIIEFKAEETLENIILTLSRHQRDCKGHH